MRNTDRLIPVEEAAKLYGCGRDSMKRMVAQGDVPGASKAGHRYLIQRPHFMAWLNNEPVQRPTGIDFLHTRPLRKVS